MKLKLIIAGCLFGASFFVSCNQEKKESELIEECVKPGLNPNGDSEMALLMRAMESDLKVQRQAIIDGTELPPIQANIEDMLTATPTDESFLNENFDSFVTMMRGVLDHYNTELGAEERVLAFNNVVNTCIGCHQNYCPGPVVRLKKLLINP